MLNVSEQVESIAAQTPPIDSKVLGAGFPKRDAYGFDIVHAKRSEAGSGNTTKCPDTHAKIRDQKRRIDLDSHAHV